MIKRESPPEEPKRKKDSEDEEPIDEERRKFLRVFGAAGGAVASRASGAGVLKEMGGTTTWPTLEFPDSFSPTLHRFLDTFRADEPNEYLKALSTFEEGVPLKEDGTIDVDALKNLRFTFLVDIPKLKIGELTDPDWYAHMLYAVRPHEKEEDIPSLEDLRKAAEIVKQITGLGDEATLNDANEVYHDRLYALLRRVVKHQGWDRDYEVIDVVRDAAEGDLDLSATADKAMARRNEVGRRESEKEIIRRQDKVDRNVESRNTIDCEVKRGVWEPHDVPGAKIFELRYRFLPKRTGLEGLTRMHIHHLQQKLWREGKVQNFDPTTVELMEIYDGIRISTTDEDFAAYLEHFVGQRGYLEIEDRLGIPSGDFKEDKDVK